MTINQTTATVLICDFIQTATATASTDSATILFADGVGMNEGDFIVNTTRDNASRRIDNIPVAGTYELLGTIENQAQDDTIRQYKFTDHTDKLLDGTLVINKQIEEDTQVTFTLRCPKTYLPRAGQFIKIHVNATHVYTGKINTVSRRLPQNAIDTYIFCDVECIPLKYNDKNRTVTIAYTIDTSSDTIITDLINNILVSEGVASGTIEEGVTLNEDWYDDCLSVNDIMDSLSEKAGYQWFVDKDFLMQFYQDPVTVSAYSQSIDDVGTPSFTDFRNVIVRETIENYNNKAFYVGNTDYYTNQIIVSQENTASILEIQDICAGSGVYGTVVRDSNMTEHTYYTASSGTSTTVIVASGISNSVDVGDLVANVGQTSNGRIERRNVTEVNGNTITLLSAISDQTVGDVIVTYPEINDVVDNHLKRSDVMPRVVEFDSFTTDFEPAQSLKVRLSKLSVSTTETYVIESVEIRDRGANYFSSHVVATKRNADDISTQRTPTYKDFFREF